MTEAQRKIERAYQRAMNIRDASPVQPTRSEALGYDADYRRCYKASNAQGFKKHTRRFLKVLRGMNRRLT